MVKSKLAIFSFVCSLVPFVTFLFILFSGIMNLIISWSIIIFNIIAFITSIISLVKIKKYNLEGTGYAIAALIISGIILLILAILIIVASGGSWGLF